MASDGEAPFWEPWDAEGASAGEDGQLPGWGMGLGAGANTLPGEEAGLGEPAAPVKVLAWPMPGIHGNQLARWQVLALRSCQVCSLNWPGQREDE